MAMIFIIATHGEAAPKLLATAEMLVGSQENVHAVDFVPGENTDTLVEKYRAIMSKYSDDTEFLFLVDLWGGSPFNAASLVAAENSKCAVVSGVSVPALLAAFDARDEEESLLDVASAATSEGRAGVRSLYLGEEQNVAVPAQLATPVAVSSSSSNYNGPSKIGSQVIEAADNATPFTIGLVRIDDRLIHGQVATVWTKVANVSRIVVIDNGVAKDKIRTTMLKQATPPGVTAHVVDVAKATRVFNNPDYAGERFMLLFTNPKDILTLVEEAKWPIKEVNVGGISYKEGKVNLSKAVNVSPEDVEAFKGLDKHGVKLDVRQVTADPSVDLMKLLRDKGL